MQQHREIEQLLTRLEVAERLAISLVTLDRLRRDGALRSVKIGRLRRFPGSMVEAYLDQMIAGLSS